MRSQKGYTLFSLVITLSISATLVLISGGIINVCVNSYHKYISRALMLREAQNTMILLKNSIPGIIPENVISAKTDHFWFVTSDNEEIEIKYKNNSGTLEYRTLGQQKWGKLLNNISRKSFTFNYLKSDGSDKPSKGEIGQVEVRFTLEIDNQEISYENLFYIRN